MVQLQTAPQSKPLPRARLPDPVVQRFAMITLGRPSSPDCRHFGVCRIEAASVASVFSPDFVGQSTSGCDGQVAALVSFRPPDFLELAIINSTVSAAVFKRHFSEGCFKIEESYCLPVDFFQRAVVLPVGCYNIEVTDTLLIIQMRGIC